MKEKKKDKKLILVVLIAIIYTVIPFMLVMGAFIITDLTQPKFTENADGSINIDDNDLTITKDLKYYYDEENETYYVEGFLVNNLDKNIDSISLEYNLYDIYNNLVGTAFAQISNVDPHGTWKFKATYSEIDAKTVVKIKLSNIFY